MFLGGRDDVQLVDQSGFARDSDRIVERIPYIKVTGKQRRFPFREDIWLVSWSRTSYHANTASGINLKQFHIRHASKASSRTPTMFSALHIAGIVVALGLVALWHWYSNSASPHNFWRFLQQKSALLAGRGLPDYAQLTGFPHPKSIPGFNIAHARPRPYRPFRWEYHQNMCMCVAPSNMLRLSVTFYSSQEVRSRLLAGTGEYLCRSHRPAA